MNKTSFASIVLLSLMTMVQAQTYQVPVSGEHEKMAEGKYEPT